MRTQKIVFILMLLTAVIFVALSECDIIPTGYISERQILYRLEMLSVISTLGGTYLALRLLFFKKIKQLDDVAKRKWMFARTAIIGFPVWLNTVLYYAGSYTTTAQYALLISLTACVFCWPAQVKDEHNSSNT